MEWFFFVLFVSALLFALNLNFYKKADRYFGRFAPRVRPALPAVFLLFNSPYFFLVGMWLVGRKLHQVPQGFLKWFVYPFYAWAVMLLGFALLAAPKDLLVGALRGARWLWKRLRPESPPPAAAEGRQLSRRGFLHRTAAVVPPLLFGISAYGLYDSDNLEISPEQAIPVSHLPRALDGLTITQISDLHAGAYIRERELARVVEEVNRLRSNLVVVTGDILDSSLEMLPVAQAALERLRSELGVYGILGNHDYYSDRRRPGYPGCLRIIEGMERVGVKMLRNSRAEVRVGGERLVLVGVDWTGRPRGNPNIYNSAATRSGLKAALAGEDSGAPRLLLAHHPHVFFEAPDFGMALTLAGHTHGGGQIVIAENNGQPVALGSAIFRYVSGLYREGDHFLYVNRGIGFVGVPIRIHCPPEISRFRLVKA